MSFDGLSVNGNKYINHIFLKALVNIVFDRLKKS